MDERDLTPFRVSKYFEEQIPQVLESLEVDPEGMYQVVYRVGDLMVSAHVWREAAPAEKLPEHTEADRQFLKQFNVSIEESPSDALR